MCGRFVRKSPAEVLRERFGISRFAEVDLRPRYNLCPGEPIAIVVADGAERRLGEVRWGLVPWFAKDAKDGPRSINARSETAATRPAFRDAFRRRRCLVVADGFYEWRHEGRSRLPHYFRLAADGPFAFAGLWERWLSPEGKRLVTGTILTCPAQGRVAEVHDRMPVILPPSAYDRWLDRSITEPASLEDLLRPRAPAEAALVGHEVPALVNSPRNDSPELIVPVSR